MSRLVDVLAAGSVLAVGVGLGGLVYVTVERQDYAATGAGLGAALALLVLGRGCVMLDRGWRRLRGGRP